MNIDPDTGPTPLQWLLIQLEAMPGCERTKGHVMAVLRNMVGQRMRLTVRDLVRPEATRIARVLIDAGMPPGEARRELAARLRISRDRAERLVTRALTQRAHEAIAARSHQMTLDLGSHDGPA